MDETPYSQLPRRSFWKTGVAEIIENQKFQELCDRQQINRESKFASVGSCFATHVGSWLRESGFAFNRSALATNSIDSFPFGNIYTPRVFLQWLELATEDTNKDFSLSIAEKDNRYFDLLRPSFKKEGFTSTKEVLVARQESCAEFLETIRHTDLLFFTLGLTEAWKDSHEVFYPMCPGTLAGTYNPGLHQFYNFSLYEITDDLVRIGSALRQVNPNLNVVLTVSPVPLTATASTDHVLVATTYSKSVLRTAAGQMAKIYRHFDYFPSYELIQVPLRGDFRFEQNRRSISRQGVAYVMEHLLELLPHPVGQHPLNQTPIKTSPSSQAPVQEMAFDLHEDICDEEFLEQHANVAKTRKESAETSLWLMGDSHMGKLSTAFQNLSVVHSGGMIMNGSGFAELKFVFDDGELFIPLESAESREIWSKLFQAFSQSLNTNRVVITNIGLHLHMTIRDTLFIASHKKKLTVREVRLTVEEMNELIELRYRYLIEILIKLREKARVIVVSDPNFYALSKAAAIAPFIPIYHAAFSKICDSIGCEFFNFLTIFTKMVHDKKIIEKYFIGEDIIHGSPAYYELLAQELTSTILNKN